MLDNKEIWKDIKGYEGLYQVSNMGRIWSIQKQKYLKPQIKHAYENVNLYSKNHKMRTERVHRLVALMFCDKSVGCTVVNHINGNKRDNRAENLEWVTVSENTKHAYDNNLGFMKEIQLKAAQMGAAKITYTVNIYKEDELVGIFYGKENAAEALGINTKTIYNCIHENRKTRDGYSFEIQGGDAV